MASTWNPNDITNMNLQAPYGQGKFHERPRVHLHSIPPVPPTSTAAASAVIASPNATVSGESPRRVPWSSNPEINKCLLRHMISARTTGEVVPPKVPSIRSSFYRDVAVTLRREFPGLPFTEKKLYDQLRALYRFYRRILWWRTSSDGWRPDVQYDEESGRISAPSSLFDQFERIHPIMKFVRTLGFPHFSLYEAAFRPRNGVVPSPSLGRPRNAQAEEVGVAITSDDDDTSSTGTGDIPIAPRNKRSLHFSPSRPRKRHTVASSSSRLSERLEAAKIICEGFKEGCRILANAISGLHPAGMPGPHPAGTQAADIARAINELAELFKDEMSQSAFTKAIICFEDPMLARVFVLIKEKELRRKWLIAKGVPFDSS